MRSEQSRSRLVLLAYGVLLILAPVVMLAATLGFLVVSGNLVLGRVTPLEFIELYVIELLIFATFGYGLYRLTIWVAEHRLPALLDALEAGEAGETRTDDTPRTEEDE